MRNYLKELNIVGGVMVWSEGEICRYGIETLIEHCDKVAITMDYSDNKTKSIVMEYKDKYPDRIIIGTTDGIVPPLLEENKKNGHEIMSRLKNFSGQLVQCNLDLVKKEHEKKPIDLLYFIGSDEIFTENIGKVATDFWESSVDTLFIMPIEVYLDMKVVCDRGLISHAKIYKYVSEITSIPYGQQNYYLPYRRKRNIWKKSYNFVHLNRLTEENIKLRNFLRGERIDQETKLRRISKEAYKLTPEEAYKVYTSKLFIKIKDWDNNIESIPLIL